MLSFYFDQVKKEVANFGCFWKRRVFVVIVLLYIVVGSNAMAMRNEARCVEFLDNETDDYICTRWFEDFVPKRTS